MAAGILPPQRREIVVRGDGNCFYRAIALWRDETGYRKPKEIQRLSSSFIGQHPQVFQPFLFSSSSVEEHVKKSKITGTWKERSPPAIFLIYTRSINDSTTLAHVNYKSLSKFTAFGEETALRHTFLSSDLQCLPPSDPRIL